MKSRPIICKSHEVAAIAAGQQTQLRRVVKLGAHLEIEEKDDGGFWPWYPDYVTGGEWDGWAKCPYGVVGDRLQVKNERLELEITGIRVEHVQEISGADAIAGGAIESVQWANEEAKQSWLGNEGYAKGCYRHLWNEINGKKHPWSSNPWVWVVEFKRVDDCQNCVHANQGACCGGVR